MILTANSVETRCGRIIDYDNPDINQIDIIDIAHALSMQCRFNGHCREFYSVAEHSWHCSFLVDDEYALTALLHDASEAYLCDIPKPLKPSLTNYREKEIQFEKLIAKKYGLQYPFPPQVKQVDVLMLATEQAQLFDTIVDWKLGVDPINTTIECWDWRKAKDMFLHRFTDLVVKKFK